MNASAFSVGKKNVVFHCDDVYCEMSFMSLHRSEMFSWKCWSEFSFLVKKTLSISNISCFCCFSVLNMTLMRISFIWEKALYHYLCFFVSVVHIKLNLTFELLHFPQNSFPLNLHTSSIKALPSWNVVYIFIMKSTFLCLFAHFIYVHFSQSYQSYFPFGAYFDDISPDFDE